MIPQSALLAQLRRFIGWRYNGSRARYPMPGPGWGEHAPPCVTNCCCFVEGLIIPAAANHVAGLLWTLQRHRQMMVLTGDLFGPITALVAAGLAHEHDVESSPPDWTVCQGWDAEWKRGHTFIVAMGDPPGGLLILEATNGWGLDGVGWRGVGPLSDLVATPQAAWRAPVPVGERRWRWDWDRVRATYPHLRAAALLVDMKA